MQKKIKIMTWIQSMLMLINSFLIYGRTQVFAMVQTSVDFMSKFNAFLDEYKTAVNVVLSGLLLTSFLTFIYHVVQLTNAADNPPKRKEALHNLLVCGVCLAVHGSVTLFIMVYFYIFN